MINVIKSVISKIFGTAKQKLKDKKKLKMGKLVIHKTPEKDPRKNKSD